MSLMNRDEIKDFISETVESVMKSITTNIQKLISEKVEEKTKEKKDLEERMKSLEYEKDCLKDRLAKAENSLLAQKDRLAECEKIALASAQRSNYNEQYSRENNVKILNIPERASETEQTLTEQVCTILLSKGNVDLDTDNIIAIHRIPGMTGSPQPVLLKLKNNSVKSSIMKQRKTMKEAGFRLVDDVTKLNTGLIGRLLIHPKID